MAILDATPGGTASNSFCTIAEAEDYLSTQRLHAESWLKADTGRILRHYDDTEEVLRPNLKAASLMWATARLNGMRYSGERAEEAQALAWPRIQAYDVYGIAIADDVVPDALKFATAEWALFAIENETTGALPATVTIGPVSVSGMKSGTVPPIVSDLIGHLTLTGVGFSRKVVRV